MNTSILETSETLLLWSIISTYLLVLSLHLYRFFLKKEKKEMPLLILIKSAWLLLTILITLRWVQSGHPPINGTFEASLASAWFLNTIYLGSKNLISKYVWVEIIMALFSIAQLVHGAQYNREHVPLTISEQSIFVDFHALFSWLAYGYYLMATAIAVTVLTKKQEEREKNFSKSIRLEDNTQTNPPGKPVSFLLIYFIFIGFFFQTLMMCLGSFYSFRLHGTWFLWDPVEILAMISWLIYGLILHTRIFYGYSTRKVARLTIVAMGGTLILYWGLVFIPWTTFHIFDMELRFPH